ncbi:MAG: hypothetical protein IK028_04985 [Bacilli bacterium]|nr:hypothetical protein [Bacilli bacterium]
MWIYNHELKFGFEIPDDFEEIEKKDYKKYHIHEGTLNIFIKFDGVIPHTISINRDDKAESEEEYNKLVWLNIENMEKIGMRVTQHLHHYKDGRRVDIIYSHFKKLKYVTYFTTINGTMIACSIEIKEINDAEDKIVAALFESIEC